MISRLVGILGALVLAGWLYWLTARVQVLLDHAEATLERADRTLAAAVAMVAAPQPPVQDLTEPTGPPPADGPPTVPSGMALELEKRALVERAFPVHGAPRRFTFKASGDGAA